MGKHSTVRKLNSLLIFFYPVSWCFATAVQRTSAAALVESFVTFTGFSKTDVSPPLLLSLCVI